MFTSPSSVDREPKATRSGNARLHGMRCVTPGSMAYIATQVCPSISASLAVVINNVLNSRYALLWLHPQFFLAQIPSRTPRGFTPAFLNCSRTLTRSKKFMISTFGGTGMCIWNYYFSLWLKMYRQVFPSYSAAQRTIAKDSALARIREKRAMMRAQLEASSSSNI